MGCPHFPFFMTQVIHAEARAGHKKVESAAAAIQALNSGVEVVTYDEVGLSLCGILYMMTGAVDRVLTFLPSFLHVCVCTRTCSPSPPPAPRGSCGTTTWWWTRATIRPRATCSTMPACSSPRWRMALTGSGGCRWCRARRWGRRGRWVGE